MALFLRHTAFASVHHMRRYQTIAPPRLVLRRKEPWYMRYAIHLVGLQGVGLLTFGAVLTHGPGSAAGADVLQLRSSREQGLVDVANGESGTPGEQAQPFRETGTVRLAIGAVVATAMTAGVLFAAVRLTSSRLVEMHMDHGANLLKLYTYPTSGALSGLQLAAEVPLSPPGAATIRIPAPRAAVSSRHEKIPSILAVTVREGQNKEPRCFTFDAASCDVLDIPAINNHLVDLDADKGAADYLHRARR